MGCDEREVYDAVETAILVGADVTAGLLSPTPSRLGQ